MLSWSRNVCCRAVHICCCYNGMGGGGASLKRGLASVECVCAVCAGLIWQRQRQRRNLLLAWATWCGHTVSGGSMSYLHIKYRSPCKVLPGSPTALSCCPLTSHKQISLSFRVRLCVCVDIPHGLVSVAKLIVFTSALHTLQRRWAGQGRPRSISTVESRLAR